jgi:hypothetical protein
MIDPLESALSELALKAEVHDIPLIVGGGYGLVLRARQVHALGIPTLRAVPAVRSTQDLDLFLKADLLVDERRIAKLRDILHELGYQAVTGAEYYQFMRELELDTRKWVVKIDLLASLPLDVEKLKLLKYDRRRARPRGVKDFHAHTAPEACSVGDYVVPVDLENGARIHLPHPFSYAVLKLFALRDRIGDQRKDMGWYHAFDLYTIFAMITEQQWGEALMLRDNFPDPRIAREARRIVHDLFADTDSRGILALRQHAMISGIASDEIILPEFLRDIHELFPPL